MQDLHRTSLSCDMRDVSQTERRPGIAEASLLSQSRGDAWFQSWLPGLTGPGKPLKLRKAMERCNQSGGVVPGEGAVSICVTGRWATFTIQSTGKAKLRCWPS